MTDVHIAQEFTDEVLQAPSDPQEPCKLPRIDRNPSREGIRSKAEKRKTPPLLPNIKSAQPPPTATPPTQLTHSQQADPEPDTFAMEIEERLRMVLQNVKQGESSPGESGCESETDFQALIQQNKQRIKHNKQQAKQEGKPRSNTLKNKNQNSLYERRMKDYREASVQNKFIHKKKEIIALKQEAIERAHDKQKSLKAKEENGFKLKEEQLKNSSTGVGRPNIPKSNNRLKFSAKQRKLQETQPPLPTQAKTADLFDNIHHFLQNPHKGRVAGEVHRNSKDNIKQLTDKIKQINQKLGLAEETVQSKTGGVASGGIQGKTVLDWKRLQYNRGSNFRCHYDSNFQKEVDRIGTLQEKTSHSLNRFLDHQKTLVALTLLKKVPKKTQEKAT